MDRSRYVRLLSCWQASIGVLKGKNCWIRKYFRRRARYIDNRLLTVLSLSCSRFVCEKSGFLTYNRVVRETVVYSLARRRYVVYLRNRIQRRR